MILINNNEDVVFIKVKVLFSISNREEHTNIITRYNVPTHKNYMQFEA